MTNVGPTPVSPSATAVPAGTSFVEWGAVLAGAFLAAAISFVLLTFAASIGLSATSPWPNSGASAKTIGSLAVFFAMVQQIGAFMAGGYIAGRMRSRWAETNADEVDFRDGLHGGLVWAVGVVIGAAILFSAAGGAAKTGADLAGKATMSAAATADPMDTVLDTMLRPMTTAQAAAPPAGTPAATAPPAGTAGAATATRRQGAPASTDDPRAEIGRLIASSVASGSMTEPNRAYLSQLVAQRTGLSQAEADRRINEAITQAREAADKARRAALLTGFVTAASLVVSLGAAWWAAIRGGNHRDNSIPARFDFNQRRRTVPTT